jgi:hypothetical protein
MFSQKSRTRERGDLREERAYATLLVVHVCPGRAVLEIPAFPCPPHGVLAAPLPCYTTIIEWGRSFQGGGRLNGGRGSHDDGEEGGHEHDDEVEESHCKNRGESKSKSYCGVSTLEKNPEDVWWRKREVEGEGCFCTREIRRASTLALDTRVSSRQVEQTRAATRYSRGAVMRVGTFVQERTVSSNPVEQTRTAIKYLWG